MGHLRICGRLLVRLENPESRTLAIRHSVDNFATAVGTVAACKEARIRRLATRSIDHNLPLLYRHVPKLRQQLCQRRLPDCRNQRMACKHLQRTGCGLEPAIHTSNLLHLQQQAAITRSTHSHWQRSPEKLHTLFLCMPEL